MKSGIIYSILFFAVVSPQTVMTQESITQKHRVYLIPGQGADYRLFNNLFLDEKYEPRDILLIRPGKNSTMKEYAFKLAEQIDTTKEFSIIGVSMGGMLAVELNELLQPKQTIIISSAKSRVEIPARYLFMKIIPINKIVPSGVYKAGSKVAQPIVEPDRKNGKETFVQMLNDKDAKFLKRSTNMIVNWDREIYSEKIIHIHGTKDHTLPYKNVNANYSIEGGSHMMVFTRGEEVSILVNQILNKE